MERVNRRNKIELEIRNILKQKYKKYFEEEAKYLFFEEIHKEMVVPLDSSSDFDTLDLSHGDIIVFQLFLFCFFIKIL